MHLDGNDFIYTGVLTVTQATWNDFSEPKRAWFLIKIGDSLSGSQWSLQFESRVLNFDLIPGIYEMAERAAFASPGHPGIDITGEHRGCDKAYGRFQIHSIDQRPDGKFNHLLVSFEQRCPNSPTQSLTGCLQFEP